MDSALAFTVDGTLTEGLFLIGDKKFYLESAKKYSSFAGNDDKVFYQPKDKVRGGDFVCGLDEAVARQLERTDAYIMSFTDSPQWN